MTEFLDNGLRVCECEAPSRHPSPNHATTCVRCGFKLDPAWDISSHNVSEFFHHLRNAFPIEPPMMEEFIEKCMEREAHGRHHFDLQYMNRDNCAEGFEEAADAAIYAMLEELRAIREGDSQLDMALTVAYKAYDLYYSFARFRAKRHGQP